MDLKTYQPSAARTMNEELSKEQRISNCALGLADEILEVQEVVFPAPDYTATLLICKGADRDRLLDEIGDVTWYSAVFADTVGITLDDVYKMNSSLPKTKGCSVKDKTILIGIWVMRLGQQIRIITNHSKKRVFHKHEWSADQMNELRMALASITRMVRYVAVTLGSSLEEVCQQNIDKLAKRYPDAKFKTEHSVNRVG